MTNHEELLALNQPQVAGSQMTPIPQSLPH
jgi:hypothetical protein